MTPAIKPNRMHVRKAGLARERVTDRQPTLGLPRLERPAARGNGSADASL